MGFRRYDSGDWERASLLYRIAYRLLRRPVREVFDVRARGLDRFPREEGALVAMNHFSWIDPLVIGDVSPRPIRFLAKEELFDGPLKRRLFEALGQIEVDRRRGGNEPALENAREELEQGGVIGIYPEGTRSYYGEMLRPRRGVARLALETGVPVVPVALLTHHVWPKGPLVPRLGEPTYVNVGEPMRWKGKSDRAGDRAFTQEVADAVMDEVETLLEEAEAAYQRGEDWDW